MQSFIHSLTRTHPQKAKATVHHRRKLSSGEAMNLVAGESFTPTPAPTRTPLHPRRDTVDTYGFEISITQDQEQALARCAARQVTQKSKWNEWCRCGSGGSGSTGGSGLPPEDRLKKLCRKGVPPELRKWVWSEVSGSQVRRTKHGPGYYAAAVEGGRGGPCAHQIQLDVPRTFPACAWIQSDAGQAALRRVLFAFAHHNPTIGYCQGMNYVAALLIVTMEHDEEAAFWVLSSLIDNPGDEESEENDGDNGDGDDNNLHANQRGILYQDMYANDLSGCHVEMRSLRELVAVKLPHLASHMEGLRCDMSILATDWFLCLFCTSLPAETAARVWDALLHEGPKVLYRVALALLKMHEPALLATDNPGDLLRVARSAAAEEFDRDELMRVAFDGVGSLPMGKIRRYRDKNQVCVDKEMAAREMRANLRAAVKQGYVMTADEEELLREPEEGSDGGRGGRWRRLGSALAGEVKKVTERVVPLQK